MKTGDLARVHGEPIDAPDGWRDGLHQDVLGVIVSVYTVSVSIQWPNGLTCTFRISDVECLG